MARTLSYETCPYRCDSCGPFILAVAWRSAVLIRTQFMYPFYTLGHCGISQAVAFRKSAAVNHLMPFCWVYIPGSKTTMS